MTEENSRFEVSLIRAVGAVIFFLFIGTVFFHIVEGWNFVDSFYFTGITLTTVGYGDLVPTKDLSKIAVVLFAFIGFGIIAYSLGIVAQHYFMNSQRILSKLPRYKRYEFDNYREQKQKNKKQNKK